MLVELNVSRLERMGYDPVGSTCSREALEMFRASPRRFDLVITDYTMPCMTGLDLAKRMKKVRPDIPIIMLSGLDERTPPEKIMEAGIAAYACKAASRQEVAELIQKVLEDPC